jgi:thioredoxin 1
MVKVLIFILSLLISSQTLFATPPVFTNSPEDAFTLAQEIKLDILLVFGAKWCPACLVMKNDIHKDLSLVESLIVCYIDFNDRPDMVKEYKVRQLPDYMIYKNNVEVKRITGYDSKEKFKEWISK